MGPLRRRLITTAALTLLAGPAFSGICETHRPDWSPQDGSITEIGELFHMFTSIPGLAILGAFTLGLTRGRTLDWLLAAFLPVVIGVALAVGGTGEDTLAMIAEGCAGPSGLSVTVCIVLALIACVQSLRSYRSGSGNTSDTGQ